MNLIKFETIINHIPIFTEQTAQISIIHKIAKKQRSTGAGFKRDVGIQYNKKMTGSNNILHMLRMITKIEIELVSSSIL